ncbi:hypothetical protein MTO96_026527 [Rhipicephalus appendiculatus]
MAGMAWTLHPALFYEKYGTVLVQLWESGDVGTLFNPVRRLSRSIGDRITSLRRPHSTTATAATKAGTVGGAAEAPGLTDESSAATEDVTEDVTEDDAMSRVNREPGDTSSEPSTSQQNELAFQGDIYTKMRRNRRQRQRLQKIRETRAKFLEGGSISTGGSEFGRKRHAFQRRGSSILVSKKDRGLRKADGGGTPLTDMEGVQPARAVVIDVSGSPGGSSSSEDDVVDKVGGKRGATIQADELLEENDSLQAFRDVRGTSKRGHRSPPPASARAVGVAHRHRLYRQHFRGWSSTCRQYATAQKAGTAVRGRQVARAFCSPQTQVFQHESFRSIARRAGDSSRKVSVRRDG